MYALLKRTYEPPILFTVRNYEITFISSSVVISDFNVVCSDLHLHEIDEN